MKHADFFWGKLRDLSTKNFVYYLFPVLLIAILYLPFLPFNQTYIGEWHDIFANSLYYTITGSNYFATWNNLWIGGFPLSASPHSDKYYPFSFPFYLIFQNISIVNFIILLHLVIAYFSFYKLGSLITKNNNALLIFSVFYAFSGIMLGRVYAGHHLLLYGLAWLPLIYYFFLKMVQFKETTILNLIGLSLVSTLVYLTGNLYHFILVYLLLFVLFASYAAMGRIDKKLVYYLLLSVFLTSLLLSIKVIPDFGVAGAVIRQDIIDPLAGGGAVETAFSSFVTGIRIDNLWAQYESGVMIGIIPILLMIVALLYGKKEIAIPAFFAILFSLIWAAGGKTLFFLIHYLPIIDNFRNPGRIFGALLPLILLLSIYGTIIIYDKMKNNEGFLLDDKQKRMVALGVVLLILVKVCELPYQEMLTTPALVSVIIIAAFVGLLYFQKGSFRSILTFFLLALLGNAIIILATYPTMPSTYPIELLLIAILLVGFLIFALHGSMNKKITVTLCGILLAGIFVMMMGNLGSGYITENSPNLDESPAQEIIRQIRGTVPENTPLISFETGVPIWHMDFTYWNVVNGIQPLSAYSAYYLKTIPELGYTIGNVTYYTPNYIVDTAYRENGQQNIPNVSFTVQNISVFIPEPVLPTVFIVRQEEVIPLILDTYTPGNVIASGNVRSGDVVVLKQSYYPGWKVNGADAINIGNMVGTHFSGEAKSVQFVFDPLDYKIGAFLSGLGALTVILLLSRRVEVDQYIIGISAQVSTKREKKRKS